MAQTPYANPYLNRSMIRSAGEFYGRRRELRQILSRIGAPTPQSVSIVGQRRMGKSSLLWHLAQKEIHEVERPELANAVFLFLDFQGCQHMDQNACCDALTRDLATAAAGRFEVPAGGGLSGFVAAAEAVDAAGLRLVGLFDEFETVTRNTTVDAEFFGALRSLANGSNVAFVTASHRPLRDLCHSQQIRESPFFNIFYQVNLGPMAEDEVEELISAPSAATGMPLAPHAELIGSLAGRLPFFLQIACAAAVESLGEGRELEPDRLRATFLLEADSHFHYFWDTFDDRERAAVTAAVHGDGDIDGPTALELETKGFLSRRGDGWQLFSAAMADVVTQEPETGPSEGSQPGFAPTRSEIAAGRILRNPYAVVAVIVLAIAAVGLWASRDRESPHRLQASTLSQARVAALGLSVEVQYQVRDGDSWQQSMIAVNAEQLAATEPVRLRAGDHLRLALSAQGACVAYACVAYACVAYAFALSPAGVVLRVPEHDSRPITVPPARSSCCRPATVGSKRGPIPERGASSSSPVRRDSGSWRICCCSTGRRRPRSARRWRMFWRGRFAAAALWP